MTRRKICLVTGSRAEYGLLKPLAEEIRRDKRLALDILVTGSHLSAAHGLTYREIVADGFSITEKVPILSGSDSAQDIALAAARALRGYADFCRRQRPAITVILGDRYEIFAIAAAAHICRIPVGHIHGGELTEGVMDDAFRHSITKMSHMHFTASDVYRKRVIQLGESPSSVFTVGALGIDGIGTLRLLPKSVLEKDLGFRFHERNLLITFHPTTLEGASPRTQFGELLKAVDGLARTGLIFTRANADEGGAEINEMADAYVSRNRDRAALFPSLGRLRYLSVMKIVDAVVGNSSSGIIEAPSMKTATVNIGDRQRGRLRALSVIDCEPRAADIAGALRTACSGGFRKKLSAVKNPYGDGRAAKKIAAILKSYDLAGIMKKKFYDLSCTQRERA